MFIKELEELFNPKTKDTYKLLVDGIVQRKPAFTVGEMVGYLLRKDALTIENDNMPLVRKGVKIIDFGNFVLDVPVVRHELVQIMGHELKARGVPADEAANKASAFIDNKEFSLIAPLVKQYRETESAFYEGGKKHYGILPKEIGKINNFIDSESEIVKRLIKEITEGYGEKQLPEKKGKPSNIDELLKEYGIRGYSFEKITGQELNRVVKDDFRLSSKEGHSAIELAQYIRAVAEKGGVKLEDLKDIKEVMGFDGNPRNLSDRELSAYLVGKAASNGISDTGGSEVRLRPDTSAAAPLWSLDKGSMESALAIGRQVFIDTYAPMNQNIPDNKPIRGQKGAREFGFP